MSYEEVAQLALQCGLSKEEAENLAMSMQFQGITQAELIKSAIRIQLAKN